MKATTERIRPAVAADTHARYLNGPNQNAYYRELRAMIAAAERCDETGLQDAADAARSLAFVPSEIRCLAEQLVGREQAAAEQLQQAEREAAAEGQRAELAAVAELERCQTKDAYLGALVEMLVAAARADRPGYAAARAVASELGLLPPLFEELAGKIGRDGDAARAKLLKLLSPRASRRS